MGERRTLSIVTPCYNEQENVAHLCEEIRRVMAPLEGRYDWEHIFIDNASRDRTVELVKEIAARDPRVKLIVNTRNFGHIRSPFHGLLQAGGDAVVLMASDLQDPPDLIPRFVEQWEKGLRVVVGVKATSEETAAMFAVRKLYYGLIGRISDIELTRNYTGFGLYDRTVVETLRGIPDPYPYFRGLIAELGWERGEVVFRQPTRKRGISTNNFYTLYDMAMLGITTHSKVPLRLATLAGFALSAVSLATALGYLVAKLLFWNRIPFGFAPLLIGVFFLGSVQLFFIGLLGEYIGFIYTQVLRRPLVIEKERVNFGPPKPPAPPAAP